MSDFRVKSDAVDVDAIMRQIRERIREKRGTDYTEAEVQDLAKVKLEQFLDPKGIRSDLVAQFRKHRTVSQAPPNYEFEDDTIYATHRGLLRSLRRLLNPILKLFFNPNKISEALHVQAKVNQEFHQRFRQREDMDPLYYELVHNLALEMTRLGIEVHNLKMRVESVSSRLDFDERRARALESVVQYRPSRPAGGQRPQPARGQGAPDAPAAAAAGTATEDGDAADAVAAGQGEPAGDGERRRRRRRRRRRPGQTMGDQMPAAGPNDGTDAAGPDDGDGPDEGASAAAEPPSAAPDDAGRGVPDSRDVSSDPGTSDQ